MILKFDHIAYACQRQDLPQVLAKFPNYRQIFSEKSLKNIKAKRELMTNKNLSYHDIVMLNSNNGLPIEITAYDEITGRGKYSVQEKNIICHTADTVASDKFFTAIGLEKQAVARYKLNTFFDNTPFYIKLVTTPHKDKCFINSSGYSCIGLIVNNVAREKQRLSKNGIETTAIDELIVNGKSLKIFFAYSNAGDMVEFIEVSK